MDNSSRTCPSFSNYSTPLVNAHSLLPASLASLPGLSTPSATFLKTSSGDVTSLSQLWTDPQISLDRIKFHLIACHPKATFGSGQNPSFQPQPTFLCYLSVSPENAFSPFALVFASRLCLCHLPLLPVVYQARSGAMPIPVFAQSHSDLSLWLKCHLPFLPCAIVMLICKVIPLSL